MLTTLDVNGGADTFPEGRYLTTQKYCEKYNGVSNVNAAKNKIFCTSHSPRIHVGHGVRPPVTRTRMAAAGPERVDSMPRGDDGHLSASAVTTGDDNRGDTRWEPRTGGNRSERAKIEGKIMNSIIIRMYQSFSRRNYCSYLSTRTHLVSVDAHFSTTKLVVQPFHIFFEYDVKKAHVAYLGGSMMP